MFFLQTDGDAFIFQAVSDNQRFLALGIHGGDKQCG
jgi:hypothetical protein